jgi:hypothetical protein
MSLKCGIVGLPNVGKSTLFNALTETQAAQAANYPFCTIEPNVGNVAVPDTHYYQVLFYSPEGELLRKLGGQRGNGPGQFNWVTDVAQDSAGNYYVSEYGELDRIQKFTSDGQFLLQWGEHGDGPGQFVRPQSLAIDEQDRDGVPDGQVHQLHANPVPDQRSPKNWSA